MNLILASSSPRRRELMELFALPYTIMPPIGEEQMDSTLPPDKLVEQLARQKAQDVAARAPQGSLILAADTVVAIENTVLGKPKKQSEAVEMLHILSGKRHAVYTGVCMFNGTEMVVESEQTLVCFRALTQEEITAYVASGEPMDKAGAYGIQGRGALLVSGIEGDYFNVMGLPVCRVGQMFTRFGIHPLG